MTDPTYSESVIMGAFVKAREARIYRQATDAWHAFTSSGGATVSLSGEGVPTRGYLVSDGVSEYVVKTCTVETIARYITTHYDALNQLGTFLGLWQTDDAVYLDVTDHWFTAKYALQAARLRGEKAIYDVVSGTCITTETDVQSLSSDGTGLEN